MLLSQLPTNWKYHTSYSDSMMDPQHITSAQSISQIFSTKNTHLVTLSRNQLRRYKCSNIRRPEQVFNFKIGQIREMQVDSFDRLWILQQDKLVCRYLFDLEKIAFTVNCTNAYPSNNLRGNNLLVTPNSVYLYS
jgi:hypothetical protein